MQSALVSDPAFAAFPASSALSAKSNQAFFANLGAQGVGARYEITVGALPAGITLNATTGVLSGTPTVSGTFPFILSASTPAGTASQTFNMVVEGTIAPVFTSAATATFTVGTAGTFTVQATGVPTTITYSVPPGTLPSGLTLNANTGIISGNPDPGTGGVKSLTITATNTSGSTNQAFTLTVKEASTITSVASTTFQTVTAGTFTFIATGYPAPTFSITGALPPRVGFNTTTGVLSGTPTASAGGEWKFTVGASNNVGANATRSLYLTANSTASINATVESAAVAAAGNFRGLAGSGG